MPFCLNAIYLQAPEALQPESSGDVKSSEDQSEVQDAGKEGPVPTMSLAPQAETFSDGFVKALEERLETFGVSLAVHQKSIALEGAMLCLSLSVKAVDSKKLTEAKVGHQASTALAQAPEALKNVSQHAVHGLGKLGGYLHEGATNLLGKEKVDGKMCDTIEKKLSASLPCRFTGPVEGHDGLQVVVLCNSVEYNDTWLSHVDAGVRNNTLSWTIPPAQHIGAALSNNEYLEKAKLSGLLRPWLILTSMQPQERALIGNSFGLEGLREESGDVEAAEAWHLLTKSGGVCSKMGGPIEKARGTHVSWAQVLVRLLHAVKATIPEEMAALDDKKAADAVDEANHSSLRADGEVSAIGWLERAVMQHMQDKFLEQLSESDRAAAAEAGEVLGKQALARVGLENFGPLALLAATSDKTNALGSAALALLKKALPLKLVSLGLVLAACPLLAIGVKAASVGYLATASNPLACDECVQEIMLQRVRLLLAGIDVDTALQLRSKDSAAAP